MSTLVVSMTTDPDRSADVSCHLRNDVTGWARQQPGFVSGEWLISEGGDAGLGVLVFDTAETATRAAAGPRHYQHDDRRAWNIVGVTVFEPVASASR